jgi:hypothetical protein
VAAHARVCGSAGELPEMSRVGASFAVGCWLAPAYRTASAGIPA